MSTSIFHSTSKRTSLELRSLIRIIQRPKNYPPEAVRKAADELYSQDELGGENPWAWVSLMQAFREKQDWERVVEYLGRIEKENIIEKENLIDDVEGDSSSSTAMPETMRNVMSHRAGSGCHERNCRRNAVH